MGKTKILDEMLEQNRGYLLTADAVNKGISKTYLLEYVNKRKLERVAQGVYLSDDAWKDELFFISIKNREVYFSNETALYLHDLMEREPTQINVTVKKGYNATHLRKKNIKVYQVREELFNLGKADIETAFGNRVKVYDRERTICDIIKHKDKMDIQVFQTGIKEYMKSKGKDLTKLMIYAKEMGIEKQVRNYLEVML